MTEYLAYFIEILEIKCLPASPLSIALSDTDLMLQYSFTLHWPVWTHRFTMQRLKNKKKNMETKRIANENEITLLLILLRGSHILTILYSYRIPTKGVLHYPHLLSKYDSVYFVLAINWQYIGDTLACMNLSKTVTEYPLELRKWPIFLIHLY